MQTAITFIIFFFLAATSFAQFPKKANKRMGQNPIVFLDSIEIEKSVLQKINPFDISNISIVKPRKAKKLLGHRGVDGAVYITTITAAKISYWNYFRTKSHEYRQLLNSPQADTIVQYVLNGEALSDTAAVGSLFLITDKNFKRLDIIDKEKLLSDNVVPKRYIIAITAKHPRGVVRKKN